MAKWITSDPESTEVGYFPAKSWAARDGEIPRKVIDTRIEQYV